MALKLAVSVRNAMLDAIETDIGVDAILKIRSGAAPTNLTDSDSGTVLSTLELPTNWMADASGGSKALAGTWQDLEADASGTAGHFRMYAADGTTVKAQGNITASEGGGDMELDNTVLAAGQEFNVTSFSFVAGNG